MWLVPGVVLDGGRGTASWPGEFCAQQMLTCDSTAPRLQRRSSRADRGGAAPLARERWIPLVCDARVLAGAKLPRRLADQHGSAAA